jgi:2-oxoglutarate dehydrogenase E2 component (dihydrolipoamide succinyltransferase)
MSLELKVPTLGESITEATVSKWFKKIGESFDADEPLVEIETDKITVEVPAPISGVLSEIKAEEGTDINIGGVLGIIGETKEEKKILQEESKPSIKVEESKFDNTDEK